ncbi:uncharacterized protein LOC113293912 [Papaver somniferum]|uniref:uncharacterized protein LOC113293912 n=1 Tax=Papaver somniferum TaxID=3469 RepID=UPI000E70604C|nr:uncharacterized protein LOC113293912 [Papaver somniferum]
MGQFVSRALSLQFEAANLEISRLDHFNSDTQKTLGSTIFQKEESEQHFKNQIIHVTRERDGLTSEVSKLKEDIKYLDEDLSKMERDAAKVEKLTRINAQTSKVKLFNEFCDKHGIPRERLDIEVFSEDEPSDDEKTLSDEEESDEDADDDEEAEIEVSKDKASIPTKTVDEPSSSANPTNQSRGADNVEVETTGAGAGTVEVEVTGAIPIQQLSLQS